LGLYIKNKDGGDFDGWCWPGQSSYLDFTNPRVRKWWAEKFALDKYVGSTLDLFTWNDMNVLSPLFSPLFDSSDVSPQEPSVFNGPEVSMQKDCQNLEGVEHRYWHNMYGLYMQRATAEGLTLRDKPTESLRPFVLSRAFWAGSQRYGAIWTGDNTATWGHLKIASPMLLSIGLAGLSFCGSDVGGFFGEPGAELFTRWYQAGSFTPFFRGHAHHDTKRREPWVFGDEYTNIHRSVSMTRYSLLPYWYTVFYEAYRTGVPVMRPMFGEFPLSEATFAMDDQWMIGSALLVKPVTDAGVTTAQVYFPRSSSPSEPPVGWYDFNTLAKLETPTGPEGGVVTVPAPLSTIPVFIKGGSILPRKMRLRRSSKLMFYDPYTLIITPAPASGDSSVVSHAEGQLYLDDETTLAHERQAAYAHREFKYSATSSQGTIRCSKATVTAGEESSEDNGEPSYDATNVIERIVIADQGRPPSRVSIATTASQEVSELEFIFDKASRTLTIKKPSVLVTRDWVITVAY
jgi:mannosyl-oligosaccharide alpha-1,3-glucosidase